MIFCNYLCITSELHCVSMQGFPFIQPPYCGNFGMGQVFLRMSWLQRKTWMFGGPAVAANLRAGVPLHSPCVGAFVPTFACACEP